jgi:hypothetical protein
MSSTVYCDNIIVVVRVVKRTTRYSRLWIYLAAGLCVSGQSVIADNNSICNYDILGLKLEMTAQQAEAAIRQHLNMTPESSPDWYKVNSTPRRYQPTGTFVDAVVISNGKIELVLDFAEVYPGQGTGSESLYWISYTAIRTSPADRENFVDRVLARYGHPIFTFNKDQDFWANRPYPSVAAALRAGVPVLELDASVPKLILSNESIRQKMEKAFTELQQIPL